MVRDIQIVTSAHDFFVSESAGQCSALAHTAGLAAGGAVGNTDPVGMVSVGLEGTTGEVVGATVTAVVVVVGIAASSTKNSKRVVRNALVCGYGVRSGKKKQ
jgi:hypothetical protein